MPLVEDRVRDRLGQLSRRLGDADWLDGAFSAGDLMMASVLLRVRGGDILDEFPNLAAYVARGQGARYFPGVGRPQGAQGDQLEGQDGANDCGHRADAERYQQLARLLENAPGSK